MLKVNKVSVLVTFLVAMKKYLMRSDLRKESFTLACDWVPGAKHGRVGGQLITLYLEIGIRE